MNVRIPPTSALLLRLINDFTSLRDNAEAHGDYWPPDLEAWSDFIDEHEAIA